MKMAGFEILEILKKKHWILALVITSHGVLSVLMPFSSDGHGIKFIKEHIVKYSFINTIMLNWSCCTFICEVGWR